MTTLAHDLRGALRSLLKSPSHTIVAMLTIGVGIGLNTMMFSVVRSVLLRPLPFRSPDALVRVTADLPGSGLQNVGFSVLDIDDLSERATVFEALAPVWVFDANLTGGERPERVVMAATGVNYFPILGETPQLGRVLTPQDQADGRFSAHALTVCAVLALLLVIGGVYGVMAYAVTTRTREMGIRIAIGATASDLQRGVLGDAFRTSAVGASIGLLLTAGATRFIRGMLFGVSSVDSRVFLLATLLLMAATLFASYLPARRASRIDPVRSLRSE